MHKIWSSVLMGLFLGTAGATMAQGPHHDVGGHGLWPDSLETVTVIGTVLMDSDFVHPMYYLDEDGDGNADYHLSFGPWWYVPESGAVRPEAGENVTIAGALQDHMSPPSLIVFEINGLVWREPVAYGMHGWNGDHFWDEQGDTITVAGVIMIDTTYFYHHYFLDADSDSIPEYKLGFGPPWYEPESGATRPENGEVVTIFGRVHEMAGVGMLSVYIINDVQWRPLDEPAPWSGTWIHMGHQDTVFAYCVNDSANWIGFPPGHMGGGMGMMWPDSSFVQFWQIHPDSLPGGHDDQHFMGFYFNMHDPFGRTMMDGRFGGHHGGMRFQNEHEFRFHYYDEDLQHMEFSENGMMVRYWDEEEQLWMDVAGVSFDTQLNTISFASEELSNYYVLIAQKSVTGIDDPYHDSLPAEFVLHQNYPNPFNPSTAIQFETPERAHVRLSVYNVLGQRIAVLLDENKPAGLYTVEWNGRDDSDRLVSSGIYLIKLETGELVRIRRMTLLK